MSHQLPVAACLERTDSPEQTIGLAEHARSEVTEPHERGSSWPNDSGDSFFRRKYFLDRVLGGVALVLTAPLTLAIFALVKLSSPGPGFYRQQRVGLNGKLFYIVKLRSMVVNAECDGKATWCVKNDARVTGVGRILRRLHLDELPQLLNVVQGDMSLVGPRPERPEICETLSRQIAGYHQRNTVKPGITGLAQVHLPPDETIECVRKKQVLDLTYIAQANAWLDTRLLIITGLWTIGIKGDALNERMGLSKQALLGKVESRGEKAHLSTDRLVNQRQRKLNR
jgi:lipopolysaccharide/colanic/teichoic acid biosynthesis glycosyltransferase